MKALCAWAVYWNRFFFTLRMNRFTSIYEQFTIKLAGRVSNRNVWSLARPKFTLKEQTVPFVSVDEWYFLWHAKERRSYIKECLVNISQARCHERKTEEKLLLGQLCVQTTILFVKVFLRIHCWIHYVHPLRQNPDEFNKPLQTWDINYSYWLQ